MKILLVAWIALGIVVGLHLPLAAQSPQTISADRLQRQKEIRQQASDDARTLVSEVLDVQLQQFKDNNLTSHPWYTEICSMRNHLDDMVNKQMKEVVDILEKAETSDNAQQRVVAFQAARGKSREILVRIQVEQQILLRRLKIAELARQIQQLIEHQTKVHRDTEALPGEPADRRHELNLAALEDQRDVTASFGQFKQNLRLTSHFSGDVGREASEAVQMVEKQQIDALLAKAEKGLRGGDFTAAAGNQKETLNALEALLQKIRQLQKTMEADSLEQKIAEALKKQEEIHEASEKKPLEPEVADKLATQQDELAKKIGEIAAAAKPEVQAALEQAKHEAQEAANNLLEQKQPEALAHQDKAALNLKAAAHEAARSQSASDSKQSQTAEDSRRKELEDKIDQLASAADKLEKAAELERQVAKDANQAAEKEGLKSDEAAGLEKKNDEATENAKSAEDQVTNSVPKAAEEVKQALDVMKEAAKDLKNAEQAKPADAASANDPNKPAEQAKTANPANADATQPESAPHGAKDTAQAAGKHADDAAQDLAKAAEEVRKEAQKAADELAKLSQDESDKLANLQQKVDKELAKAMDPTTDHLGALAQAQKKVEEALQHQAEADQSAAKAQENAKPNGDKPAGDKPNTDQSDQPKNATGDKPAADKPTGEAPAAEKPTGDKPAAEKPTGEAPAAEKPTGDKPAADKSDPQAQVSEASKQAADLAEAGAPKAAETLTKATALSDQARQDASQGPPQKAADDRNATRQALEEAKKELSDAIKQLSAEASKQIGQEAKESGELAQEARPLDTEAAKDLANAQQHAEHAAGNPAEAPSEIQSDQNGVRQDLALASAELAARQQQIAAELAQAQSQAQGNPEASQTPAQDPSQTRGQVSVTSRRSSQGAKKMSPGGSTSPDRKEPESQDIRKEPWFANLPPAARDTMRSNAQRRPPPGYERRTQEYFQNLDR